MELDFSDEENASLIQNNFFISNYLSLINRELEFYFNNYTNIKHSLNISRLEGVYLLLMKNDNKLNQSRISEILHTDITLISKVTKSLINKGYISKKSDSTDKRIKVISLNEKAYAIIPKFLEIYSEFNETALKNFTEEEHKMFGNLLVKYFSNIQSFKKTNGEK